ncbi:MAG: Ig-like domain-containing protein [Oscillospiraceae bacterium]|nr:Ig-like domain-containing protein [Oscillospiraceae bacterium]
MFRTKLFGLLAVLCCLPGLAGAAAAAEVDSGQVYCFSAEDFSAEESIAGICITGLPEDSLGSVRLGSRVLRPGDVLTAGQVAQMTFVSSDSETDSSALISYLPIYEGRVDACAAMTIGIRGKENQPPVAEDSAMETYKNLPNTGKLKVTDPEGQSMTFTVTRGPKRGTVTLGDDGSFTYTPKHNKVGVDSFTYTATDSAGKVSREATVTITILKPSDASEYSDTAGKDCRFAAEWMKHTGIFVGETLGESTCFCPEKQVTRGEFVTMLVKALDIPADEELTYTGYTDEIPQWLQPYLAAAIRSGLTAGLPWQETFGPEEAITGAEASVLLQNALDLTAAPEAMAQSDVSAPDWAQSSLKALSGNGIFLDPQTILTRADAAQALYQAALLTRQA